MLCLSSAEAEFNGGVAACSEGLFLVEVFRFFGVKLDMTVYLDSSAARGVFQRHRCGRIRPLSSQESVGSEWPAEETLQPEGRA